jgi:capsular exopolysaccharide synthesis family protein
MTTGVVPPNPSEMLSSNKMKNFIELMKEHYDYIFIDSPPIGIITDAGIISTYVDGTVMVVSSREVDIELAKIAKEGLVKVNANIIGAVLNKFENKSNVYEYYNYYCQQIDNSRVGRKKKK